MKRVRFEQFFIIELEISRGANQTTRRFDLQNTNELDDALEIINKIKALPLDLDHAADIDIYSSALKVLRTLIHQLVNCECMQDHRENIFSAVCDFCQQTLNLMPLYPTDPGKPGYEAYERQQHNISKLISNMHHILRKEGILATTREFRIPHAQPRDKNITSLPQNLPDFEKSIANNKQCTTHWVEYSKKDSRALSQYFANVLADLESPYMQQNDAGPRIIKQLSLFASALEARSPGLCIIPMMFDVVNIGRESPPPSPMKIPYNLIGKLRTLITQSGPEFNDAFGEFRDTLLLNRKEDLKAILIILKQNLNTLVISAPPHGDNIDVLQKYIDRCILRCTQPMPENTLVTRHVGLQEKYRNKDPDTPQHDKLIIINALMDELEAHPTKDFTACLKDACGAQHNNRIQKLVDECRGYSMFARDTFKEFLIAYKAAEPDYETKYPRSTQHTVAVDCHC